MFIAMVRDRTLSFYPFLSFIDANNIKAYILTFVSTMLQFN